MLTADVDAMLRSQGLYLLDRTGRRADFGRKDIRMYDFSGRDLRSLSFDNSYFYGCNFSDADMRNCSFNYSTMVSCVFKNTDMRNCKFDQAHFDTSAIVGAKFSFEITPMPSVKQVAKAEYRKPANMRFMQTGRHLARYIVDSHIDGHNLEKISCVEFAAALILKASGLTVPNFFDTDRAAAVSWLEST